MAELIRSFFAFDMENPMILNKISTVQRLLLSTGADLKNVEPANIHITIRFLGNVKLSTVEKLSEEIGKIQFIPFDIRINGLGAFPNMRYPRVIWAGITEGKDQLRNIFDQLEPKLRKLGFPPDFKGFNPHLTICRVRSGRNKTQLADFVKQNCTTDFGVQKADCLKLKKSTLTLRGPVYSTLKEFHPK